MKRHKHDLSYYRLITGNMGQLMPLGCVAVLPGDTMQCYTTAMIRLSPLNTPVMHPVQARIHWFFVPNRIIWDDWEDFITGGENGTSTPSIPTVTTGTSKGNMLSYLGLPPIAGVEVNALPLYAVNLIIDEFYRDQDLVQRRGPQQSSRWNVAWGKDYFTLARPFAQKGPTVTLPLGQSADVVTAAGGGDHPSVYSTSENEFRRFAEENAPGWIDLANAQVGDEEANKLVADLQNAQSPDVNAFRAAFAIQRYQEARARYGSRFTEYLRYLGITPSDSRLQRPEFLGGGSGRISFSEVLQTAPNAEGDDSPGVGDLFGHGISGVRTRPFRKFFEEHGYVIPMLSVRPKSIYLNGIPREFLKETKEDFYQKELVHLGQQEVWEAELYAEPNREVFGFTDRYEEYRSTPSQISNDFRDLLNAWHLGRDLAASPTLNEDFVTCVPSDRIFQVGTQTADTLWVMANNHVVARRLIPKRSNPRIL